MVKSRMTFHKTWSLAIWAVFSICMKSASAACSPCDQVATLLKPCNTTLAILTWPGEVVYQPTELQAPCACNDNYYGQITDCLKCESSSSAKYSVKAQTDYELVCTSFHQAWKSINVFPTSTTASTSTSSSGTTPSDSATSGEQTSNPLSSGALAGIIVSAIALIVALSVAAYVYGRRRRERTLDKDDYKYSDERDSYMEVALPQYNNGMQPILPPISKVSNLRVMNPDSDDEAPSNPPQMSQQQATPSFEVNRGSAGWRRGSFADD
ncbi:hypothetical protein MVEG_03322 [Podila verticillata NRRL 6337]|nr:hypothetical protein MVEG_03322 [Podila verticillata NRRL 6337]